jgi:endonuclease/exonuclease/phosphatase family metal-dependent hydrolase
MRVLTWNLWWRFGPWRRRRDAVLAVLEEARPDVVGLQEVWEHDGENLAGWLADRLGMEWRWASSPAPQRWRDNTAEPAARSGNAVLSRWPVVDRETLVLPVAGGRDDGRLALFTLLAAPGGRQVPFFTAHLNSEEPGSAVRCAQVRALARFVADRAGAGPVPPVVTGDFNAEPDSDEVRLMGGRQTAPAAPGLALLDAWQYADPATPAVTWNMAGPSSGAGPKPSARIDYVFVGPPGPGGLGRVRSVRRAGDTPVAGVRPSDHAAVVADLAL